MFISFLYNLNLLFDFFQPVPWTIPEQREMYRKTQVVRQGAVGPRYQPYTVPRYQFTSRDLDRCLYGKQDLQVKHELRIYGENLRLISRNSRFKWVHDLSY